MKKIIFIVVVISGLIFIYSLFKSKDNLGLRPSISEILKNPGAYNDTDLDIKARVIEIEEKQLKIENTKNYNRYKIIDKDGGKIILVSKKRFRKGETIDMHSYVYFFSGGNGNLHTVLIDYNLKMSQEIMDLLDPD